MNCKQIQDELLLFVGDEHLPDDIRRHLDVCPECSAFFGEITSQADHLGKDDDFFMTDAELEASVAEVESKIDRLELEKVIDVRSIWRTYVPVAAAVVVLVGMSIVIKMSGLLEGNGVAEKERPGHPYSRR